MEPRKHNILSTNNTNFAHEVSDYNETKLMEWNPETGTLRVIPASKAKGGEGLMYLPLSKSAEVRAAVSKVFSENADTNA